MNNESRSKEKTNMIKTSLDEILKACDAIKNNNFGMRPKIEEYDGPVKVVNAQKHTSVNTGKKSIELQLATPEGASFKTWLPLTDKTVLRTVAMLGAMLAIVGSDIQTIEKSRSDEIESDIDRANVYSQVLANKLEKGADCSIFAKRTKSENSDFFNVNLSFKAPEIPVSSDDFFKTVQG